MVCGEDLGAPQWLTVEDVEGTDGLGIESVGWRKKNAENIIVWMGRCIGINRKIELVFTVCGKTLYILGLCPVTGYWMIEVEPLDSLRAFFPKVILHKTETASQVAFPSSELISS